MGPLSDVRVIDLTQMLAGPYCTMLLADLGADVIKVEPPHGDFVRQIGPHRPDDQERSFGGYFQSINRGKRSVVIDLKSPGGRDELFALVRHADALVENFSAGVMERLGVAYERLRDENPRLVYGSIRGFGDARTGESPYSDWPALDLIVQAMGGLMSVTGTDDGHNLKVGVGVGDIFPAALLALGVVSGIHEARRSGVGQYVDVAMYDAVLSLCERLVYQHSYVGEVPRPQGNQHAILSPFDVVTAKDGSVIIAAPSEPRWRNLCRLIDRGDLLDDPEFASNDARARNSDKVRAILAGWAGERTVEEILQVLGGQVPVAPIQDIADIFADPHVRSRGMLAEVEHPGTRGKVTIAGSPIKFTVTPSEVRGRAPLLDEHGAEIRRELITPELAQSRSTSAPA